MSRHELWRRMKKSKFFVIGSVLVIFIVLASLFAKNIAPFDPLTQNLRNRLKAPTGEWSNNIFGADAMGRDILSRLLIGSQVSLQISISVVLLTAIIGTILGIIAGFFGGWVDTIIMRLSDVQVSIPPMILAIAVMAVLGNSVGNLTGVRVFTRWVQ